MFICVYEEYCGTGDSLKAAYDNFVNNSGTEEAVENCVFYEGVDVPVEVKIVRKEVVSKISKKSFCEA